MVAAVTNDGDAIPGVDGITRPGRNKYAVIVGAGDVLDVNFVIAQHRHVGTQFTEILDEVIDKGVVIINDEN